MSVPSMRATTTARTLSTTGECVETLCGECEDQEMQSDIAHGPLRTIEMPDGSVYEPDDSYSLFYNIKRPARTWDYGRLGSERSVLDDIIFVISEGVSLNPFTPSGYSLLFMMVAMLFFSIFVALRKIVHFAVMLASVKSSRPRAASDWAQTEADDGDEDETKYVITGLSPTAKAVGWLVFACRFFVTVGVLSLGTCYLMYTTLKIDLILNGLALLFALELDQGGCLEYLRGTVRQGVS